MTKATAYRIVRLVALIAVLVPLISHILWWFQGGDVRRILILDKTVLNTWTDEHRSFVWLLRHHRILPEKGRLYDAVDDYYGFFPLGDRQYGIRDFAGMDDAQLDSIAERYAMAYYTDTYGIYREEWDSEFPVTGIRANTIRGLMSSKIYGGMDTTDVQLMARFKALDKPVIAEFNLIGAPTGSAVRKTFEQMWGIRWSGWNGRYFRSLIAGQVADLPLWIIEAYKEQNDRDDWPFTKSGMVFVNEGGRVVVLEIGSHLTYDQPVIHTTAEMRDRYQVPASIPYPFWFDIHSHGDSLRTLAYYELSVTESGRDILDREGIPIRFPAVMTHHAEPWRFHYFAGDFADNPVSLKTAPFAGIHLVSGWFHTEEPDDRGRFFWDFYRPMMRSILDR